MPLLKRIAVPALLIAFSLHAQDRGRRPPLDSLVTAATQYWNLWASRKPLEASQYVQPSQRSDFIGAKVPPFSEPVIRSIKFTPESRRVIVQTGVKVIAPESGVPFPWTVEQEWVFDGKTWLLDYQTKGPELFSKPAETTDRQLLDRFKAGFQLKTKSIEIPMDAFGRSIDGVLEYSYSGPSGLKLSNAGCPEFFDIERADLEDLKPEGKLRYSIQGRRLFEHLVTPLRLRAQVGREIEDFIIPIYWDGKAPYRWRFTPEIIEKEFDGEIRLDVTNQTNQEWRSGSANSLTSTLELLSMPTKPVLPGESATYRFRRNKPKAGTEEKPYLQDNLTVYLTGTMIVEIPVPYPQPPSARPASYTKEELERILRSLPPRR